MAVKWGDVYTSMATEYEILATHSFHPPVVSAVIAMAEICQRPVLEVGVGSGAFTVFLARAGLEIVGIDTEPGIVRMVRELVKQNGLSRTVKIQRMDGFDLKFKAGEFSVAFSQGLLEHFDDEEIARLLAEQRRVAELVVFSVPSVTWVNPKLADERRMSLNGWRAVLDAIGVEDADLVSYWNDWMILGLVPGLPGGNGDGEAEGGGVCEGYGGGVQKVRKKREEGKEEIGY